MFVVDICSTIANCDFLMIDSQVIPRLNSSQVNSNSRLFVLDLARCIAMIMMIQGHTLDALTDPQLLDIHAFPWNIWNFIRGLTAPVFLIVSGDHNLFDATVLGHVKGDPFGAGRIFVDMRGE